MRLVNNTVEEIELKQQKAAKLYYDIKEQTLAHLQIHLSVKLQPIDTEGVLGTGAALAVWLIRFGPDHFLQMSFAISYIPTSQLATLLNSVALI